ncbi:MAG: phosphate ABC transporter, permease protein PstA, partial [Candidatus Aquicultor secundus]
RTPMDGFTVLPIQIFSWISKPQEDFSHLAAAAIMVLLAVLLSMNAVSVWLRNKYEKRTRA